MKRLFSLLLVLLSAQLLCADSLKQHPQPSAYDGWRLGVQCWSFNRFTMFEAIDKTRELGLNYIQAFPGQKVSKDLDMGFGPDLNAEQRAMVKAKLADANIQVLAFGVTGISKNEVEARKLFDFAKDMGIKMIASEPEFDQFDLLDKLCQEYQIKLGIHNHPNPNRYWNPDTVLKMCQGRSKWIGACTDVGHWVRSGLDPVECLKKLEGRIHDVHTKEIEDGHDVVWGTGQGRMKGILKELKRQGYKGTFTVEYEYNWDNNVPEIRKSAEYFDTVSSELFPGGWHNLFAADLSNADYKEGSWKMADGVLERTGSGDVWTKGKYSDYILDFDFKLDKGTNSGVFLRAAEHTWLPWPEVQVEDSFGKGINRHLCGGIYDISAPKVNSVKQPGQWNHMSIMADGSDISVVLNGKLVTDIDLNDWTTAGKNPDGSDNKFKNIAYKDLPRTGWIGFQDHGFVVWYRNVKIKELN